MAVDFTTDDDAFMASFSDNASGNGDVVGLYFSLTGSLLPPTDEQTVFATLTYELTSELSPGDVIDLDVYGVVCADANGVGLASAGVDGSISSGGMPGDVNGDGSINVQDIILLVNMILDGGYSAIADVNGDGSLNVQDIILIVNMILDSRAVDATRADIIRTQDHLLLQSDGFIGGIQMTLKHDADFSLELTDNALVAKHKTVGNETILVIVVPESEEIFSYTGDFEIVDVMVANSEGLINISQIDESQPTTEGMITEYSLSTAYPNPFNPTTSVTLAVPTAGHVSVQVYNLMGQVVATLASGHMDANTYTLTWDASSVSSGMYFVKAEVAGNVITQKLVLMK